MIGRIDYALEDEFDRDEQLPTVTVAEGIGAAVGMPERFGAALVTPEYAVALGIELVKLGRTLQAAEGGEIIGRKQTG